MKVRITEGQFEKSYERITENELGTKFEQAIIDVATGSESEFTNLPWSATSADKKQGKSTPLSNLAKKSLRHMGIKPSSMNSEDAFVFNATPEQGGDPKTDIVVDGKRISVKLPKSVQLASGEAASTLNALKPQIEAYLDRNLDDEIRKTITTSWKKLYDGLEKTSKKRFVQADAAARNKRLQDSALNKARKAGGSEKQIAKRAKEIYNATSMKMAQQIADGILIPSWEKWNATQKPKIKKAFTDVLFADEELSNLIVYELLTGKRQFADEPEMAADYILSPDGFYDLRTMEAALPYMNKVRSKIMADVRGKGRPLASKAVAARIEMDASEIYQNDIVEYWADQLGFLEDENMKQEFLLSNPDLYNASLYHDDDD